MMRLNAPLIAEIAAQLEPYRDDEAAFWDTLDGETDALDLIDRAIAGAQHDAALAVAIDAQIKALQARKARVQAREAAHRRVIAMVLKSAGMRRAERPAATVSLSPGRARARIDDETAIPSQLCTVKRIIKPDAKAILAQLQAGETVPGASLAYGDDILTMRAT